MMRVFSHYVPARLVVLILADVAVLASSAVWGGAPYQEEVAQASPGAPHTVAMLMQALYVSLMLLVINGMGLYEPDIVQSMRSVLTRLVTAALAGAAMLLLLSVVSPSPVQLDVAGAAVVAALLACGAVRYLLARWAALGPFRPRVLVLGQGSGAARLAQLARRHRNQHDVVGYIPCGEAVPERVPIPRLLPAAGESLCDVAEKYNIDHIVIAVKDRRGGALPVDQLLECRLRGVRINELSTFFEREHRQVLLQSLAPSWMVFGEGFRQGLVRATMKRLFDVVVSVILLLLAWPVMAIAAMCLLAESGRPILYRQQRVGEGGRPFDIFKFRSMRNGAEGDGTPRWAAANDDRTTRVGRFMRKTRIDELPQVFNVLRGDMSFVGPRPERPYFVDKLAERIPFYGLRHSIKPGITGWAQVRYTYGASVEDAIEKLQYDLYYVKNHTLFLDLVILAATVEVVLWGTGSGASQPDAAVAPAATLQSPSMSVK